MTAEHYTIRLTLADPLRRARKSGRLRVGPAAGRRTSRWRKSLDHICVRVKSSNRIDDARRQITALLRERHRLGSGQADDFHIYTAVVWTDAAAKQSR